MDKRNDILFVKRMDKERSQYVIKNMPEGTLYGKLWFISNPEKYPPSKEKIANVKQLPYCSQVPGYYIYVTIENYTGIDSLTDLYDINQVASQMAHYMIDIINQSPGKYREQRM